MNEALIPDSKAITRLTALYETTRDYLNHHRWLRTLLFSVAIFATVMSAQSLIRSQFSSAEASSPLASQSSYCYDLAQFETAVKELAIAADTRDVLSSIMTERRAQAALDRLDSKQKGVAGASTSGLRGVFYFMENNVHKESVDIAKLRKAFEVHKPRLDRAIADQRQDVKCTPRQ